MPRKIFESKIKKYERRNEISINLYLDTDRILDTDKKSISLSSYFYLNKTGKITKGNIRKKIRINFRCYWEKNIFFKQIRNMRQFSNKNIEFKDLGEKYENILQPSG